ncbi:hypothetical protein MYCTH_2304326 [Thermothelomyces thermophilus ATCC 42464]|uniref:Uncharacterized protein n=1 Tax=Thermothelomyces thermophilus (strain ATCC 42464 / BCRC 31852 / DSM 1799) TaxID=573729 RepID=G2QEH9_THET4|nr:uncharacterized protein MYCTH_2304326 [Thermothelomyces thermophilus ATCC 42464]AEO57762.1 hypothetical protein MYCTH_2304326 [Thermothelomyces thermophilus ATCC 42464]
MAAVPTKSTPTKSIPTESIPTESIPTESIPTESIPTESSVPTKSSRKYTTLAQRVQALTLHARGAKTSEIEAITGMKERAFYTMLNRAKERGYIPGGPVKDEHVANAPKSGRPKRVTKPVA